MRHPRRSPTRAGSSGRRASIGLRRLGALWAAGGIALLPAGAPRAAERLTLTQAIERALGHSPAILEAEARSRAAGAMKRAAQGMRGPSIQLREIALRTDSPADAFGLQLMQERFSFPDFVAGDPNDPTPINNFASEFEASWPLFLGGRVTYGIREADRMTRAAQGVHAHTRSAIALATATAYMDALLADRAAELARKARDTTARHVDQAQAFYDTGMIVESDLLQAKVQLARMEEKVIAAENGARLAQAGLARVMGVDQTSGFELDAELPAAPPVPAGLDAALAGAAERRADLRAAAAGVEAAAYGVQVARGEYLPEIAVVGKYALNDDQIFGAHGTSYSIMAVARWNVWNWGQTRAHVSASRFQHAAATQAERAQQQQVEFEVRAAWQNVGEATARLEVATQGAQQAERALSILDDRFQQGVTKVTDLLDAETMLDESRMRELNARFDVQRAIRTLNFAVGLPPIPEVSP